MKNNAKKLREGIYEAIAPRKIYDDLSHSFYEEYMNFNANNGTVIYEYGLGHCMPTPEIIKINDYQRAIDKKGIGYVGGAVDFQDFIKHNPEIYKKGLLANAKTIINEFVKEEYEQSEDADFKDLSNVEVAYTTIGDNEEYEIQASVDLINFAINKYCNSNLIESDKYNSLEELISYGLEGMSFDELVFVDEEKMSEIEQTNNELDICD